MIRSLLLTGMAALIASGCANSPCNQSLAYQKSALGPPLKAPPGLQVPQPSPDYQIPTVQGSKQSFMYKAPRPGHPDEKVTQCLILPPPAPSNNGGGVPSKAPEPNV